jgi:prolipoprotein diacylglyceryltransferase
MSSHSHSRDPRQRFPYYAVGLYVGLVAALAVADRLARWSGIDPLRLVAAFLLAIPVCLAGARALVVVLGWPHFRARPREILALSKGGAAMYGALPPLFLLSIPLARWIGIPLGTFWDAALVSILAGMIPTRLGCLGAGCCAGRRTSSRLGHVLRDIDGVRARRYPSPLFEALLGAVLLAASLLAWGRQPFPGALALAIAAAYGAGRFALEELRRERPRRYAGLGAYQWMSLALVAVALGTKPVFILLDEPFAGVDPIAVLDIQRIIRFLKERGIGVLITDHNVRETLGICDHAYIINEGAVLAAGRPDEIVYNESVRRVYLGENFRL